jgi:hypothetical protein
VHDIQDREPSEGENESGWDTDHDGEDCSPGDDDKTPSRRTQRNAHESDSDSDTENYTRHRHIHRLQTAMTGLTSSLVIGPDSRARIVRPMVELRMDSIPVMHAASSSSSFAAAVVEGGGAAARTSGAGRNDDGIPVDTMRRGTVGETGRRGLSPASVELHVSSADVWEALVAIREARVRRERERERAERERSISMRIRANIEQRVIGQPSAGIAGGTGSMEERRPGVVRIVVRRNVEVGSGSVDATASTGPSGSATVQQAEGGLQSQMQDSGRNEQGIDALREATNSSTSESSASGSSLTNALAAVISATTSVTSTTTASQGTSTSAEREWSRDGNVIHSLASGGPASSRTVLYIDNNAVHSSSGTRGGYRMNPGPNYEIPRNQHIHQNIKRLTHFIEEPNVGKGFIKELCFSADGRLICSPFGYGVRLLAFSPDCAELSTCVPPRPPVQLYELATNVCHADIVVSTKFSPQHCLLVSGCLSGKIVWHQPVV